MVVDPDKMRREVLRMRREPASEVKLYKSLKKGALVEPDLERFISHKNRTPFVDQNKFPPWSLRKVTNTSRTTFSKNLK